MKPKLEEYPQGFTYERRWQENVFAVPERTKLTRTFPTLSKLLKKLPHQAVAQRSLMPPDLEEIQNQRLRKASVSMQTQPMNEYTGRIELGGSTVFADNSDTLRGLYRQEIEAAVRGPKPSPENKPSNQFFVEPSASRDINRFILGNVEANKSKATRWLFQLIITEVNEEEIIGLLLDEESDDESEVTMPLEKLARLSGLAKEEIVEGMGFYYQVEDDGNGTARSSFTPIRRGIYLPDEEEEHQAWLNETFRNTDS